MRNYLNNKGVLSGSIILAILLVDQILKFYIKTHFYMGQEVSVIGNWFYLHFIENPGFAFGMKFGGSVGKVILTLFRIVAITAIGWYLTTLIKQKAKTIMILTITLIFAGALGNLIDSCFYGILFSDSNYEVAQFLPEGGGYAPFLFGNVVDMFYFPIIDTYLPDWVPFMGGEHFVFFRPVFNVADAAITVGVLLLIFHSLFSKKDKPSTEPHES